MILTSLSLKSLLMRYCRFEMGGAAAFKMRSLKNLFFKLLILKVQANEIRLLVKCNALHPPPSYFNVETNRISIQ